MSKSLRITTLDGMRGLAAISVVIFHAARMSLCPDIIPRGYLAVDFFFALSGFVLARAYDGRIGTSLGPMQFMVARYARLAPLFWVGVALGLAAYLIETGAPTAAPAIVAAVGANLLLVPYPLPGGINFVFPMNPPGWSLFFELWIANALFAVVWSKCSIRHIGTLLFLFWLALLVSMRFFGGNAGAFVDSFVSGFARVLFSFFAGTLVYRMRDRVSLPPLPQAAIVAILLLSFLPGLTGGVGKIYDVLCITFLYPCLVMIGSRMNDAHPRLNTFLGDASYALYCVHYPALQILSKSSIARNYHWTFSMAVTLPILVILAWALHSFADIRCQARLRRVLSRRTVTA